jgi:hypothetical protein
MRGVEISGLDVGDNCSSAVTHKTLHKMDT